MNKCVFQCKQIVSLLVRKNLKIALVIQFFVKIINFVKKIYFQILFLP